MFQHVKAARKVARPAMKSRLLEVSLARLSTVADSSTITTTVMPYRVCRGVVIIGILILYIHYTTTLKISPIPNIVSSK